MSAAIGVLALLSCLIWRGPVARLIYALIVLGLLATARWG